MLIVPSAFPNGYGELDALKVQKVGRQVVLSQVSRQSAVIYSLVQTAKANGLEPYTWLRRV